MSKQRLSAAFATMLESFVDTYFGDDKPIQLPLRHRYVCALFGTVLFMLFALVATLLTADQAEQLAALFATVTADERVAAFFLFLLLLVASALAIVVASGIIRGGPIRLFLVGVTLPALVLYIATAATNTLQP